MRIQRRAEHRVVPWANGLGTTADVFLWPPDVADWTWRLSLADVTRDVPFSVMPGIDRHILVASGAGMVLAIAGRDEVVMTPASPPLSFDGDDVTTCRLLDGPIQDLNLMVRRGAGAGSMRVVELAEREALDRLEHDVAIVVLAGSLRVDEQAAGVFDAIRLRADEGDRIVATRRARCAVAQVRPA